MARENPASERVELSGQDRLPKGRMRENTVHIDAMAHGGAGVGTLPADAQGLSGKRVFVEGALLGETVRLEILADKKRFAKGRVLEVLKASEDRVEPACSLASRCGGCNWQHLKGERQAQHKAEIALGQLRAVLSRIDVVYPSPKLLGYRRRARLHVAIGAQGIEMGFHAKHSREVTALARCPVLTPSLNQALSCLASLEPQLRDGAQIHLLDGGGEVLIGVSGVCPAPECKPELQAWLAAAPDCVVGLEFRGGRRRLRVGKRAVELDDAPDGVLPLRAGPFDFAQAQDEQNRRLLELVATRCKDMRGAVLELYCGAGNLTRVIAGQGRKVEAWDEAPGAINALKARVADGDIVAAVHQGTAHKAVQRALERGRSYTLVVVDPPRTGLGAQVVQGILDLAPQEILYVSCDPATLARDLRRFAAAGYESAYAAMLDMMPMTSELEMLVHMRRTDR